MSTARGAPPAPGGAGAAGAPPERRLFPLTGVRIGLWKPRSSWSAFLLALPASRRFVVLLTHDGERRKRGHLGTLKDNVEHLLRHKNPFFAAERGGVMAFEVAWGDVVGMDYASRLMEDTRLVLEARSLAKRVFASVEDACAHYLPAAPSTPPNSPEEAAPGGAATAATSAPLSTDGRAAEATSGATTPSASVRGGLEAATPAGAGSDAGSWRPTLSSRVPARSVSLAAAAAAAAGVGASAAPPRRTRAFAPASSPFSAAATAAAGSGGGSSGWLDRDALGAGSGASLSAGAGADSSGPLLLAASGSSEYDAALSQFPSRRSSLDSELSAPMPSTPAARAAAQALLRNAAVDPRAGRGLSRASSSQAVGDGLWRSSRQLGSGLLASRSVGSQAGAASMEVSIGDAIAVCPMPAAGGSAAGAGTGGGRAPAEAYGAVAGSGGGGDAEPSSCDDLPVTRLETALSLTSIVDSAPSGDGFTSGGSSLVARAGAPSLPPLVLRHQQQNQQQAAAAAAAAPLLQQQQQWHQQQQLQLHGGGDGGKALQQRRKRFPAGSLTVAVPSGGQQQQQRQPGSPAAHGAGCSAASAQQPAKQPGAGGVLVKPHAACPLCNQALGCLPQAWLPAGPARSSPPRSRTPPAGGWDQGYRQPQPSPVKQPRGMRPSGEAHSSAAAAAAAAIMGSAGGRRQGAHAPWEAAGAAAAANGSSGGSAWPLAPLFHRQRVHQLARSASAERALNELTAATSGRGGGGGGGGAAPGSTPASPHCAPGSWAQAEGEGGGCTLGSPTEALLHAAADLAADGGRGAYAGFYSCCTLVLTFTDPGLPRALSKLVKSDMRLLKHYESGLPAWAIVLPSYGLFYRPWMRRVTWLLFVLVSVVSMALGFYDLYKNVPHFKSLVITAFRPAGVLFEWLELHTQMRLSILLTYLLGKSPLLVQALRLVRNMAALVSEALKPVWGSLAAAGSALVWALQPLFGALAAVAAALQQAVAALLWGPLQLAALARDAVLPLLAPVGAALTSGWQAVRWGRGVARGVAGAAPAVASGAGAVQRSSWLLLSSWARLEALHLQQALVLRAVRSAQAIVRFFVTAATTLNQHRVSLMLQLLLRLRRLRQRAAESRLGSRVLALVRPVLEERRRREAVAAAAAAAVAAAAAAQAAGSAGGSALAGEAAASSFGASSPGGLPAADRIYGASGSEGPTASVDDAASEADSSHAVAGVPHAAARHADSSQGLDDGGGEGASEAGSSCGSVVSPEEEAQRQQRQGGGGGCLQQADAAPTSPLPWQLQQQQQLLPAGSTARVRFAGAAAAGASPSLPPQPPPLKGRLGQALGSLAAHLRTSRGSEDDALAAAAASATARSSEGGSFTRRASNSLAALLAGHSGSGSGGGGGGSRGGGGGGGSTAGAAAAAADGGTEGKPPQQQRRRQQEESPQAQLRRRRRHAPGPSAAVNGGAAPAALAPALARHASADGSVGSAVERAAAGLRSLKWLHRTKSNE